jgi:hypothetical protein
MARPKERHPVLLNGSDGEAWRYRTAHSSMATQGLQGMQDSGVRAVCLYVRSFYVHVKLLHSREAATVLPCNLFTNEYSSASGQASPPWRPTVGVEGQSTPLPLIYLLGVRRGWCPQEMTSHGKEPVADFPRHNRGQRRVCNLERCHHYPSSCAFEIPSRLAWGWRRGQAAGAPVV